MKILDYNHVFLYAKGHYKKTDTLKDLQAILGHRFDLEPEDVSKEEVYRTIITLGMEHMRKDIFVSTLLEAFGLRFSWLDCIEDEEKNENNKLIRLLHALFQAKYIVDGEMVNNFGEADPNILPLSEERVRKNKEGKYQNWFLDDLCKLAEGMKEDECGKFWEDRGDKTDKEVRAELVSFIQEKEKLK